MSGVRKIPSGQFPGEFLLINSSVKVRVRVGVRFKDRLGLREGLGIELGFGLTITRRLQQGDSPERIHWREFDRGNSPNAVMSRCRHVMSEKLIFVTGLN